MFITGWWLRFQPLWKTLVNWDDDVPNIWKNISHVPVTTNQIICSLYPSDIININHKPIFVHYTHININHIPICSISNLLTIPYSPPDESYAKWHPNWPLPPPPQPGWAGWKIPERNGGLNIKISEFIVETYGKYFFVCKDTIGSSGDLWGYM